MKKFILLLAIMLFGMSVSILAQPNDNDSLQRIYNTLSQYKVVYADSFHEGYAKIGVRKGEELLVGLINKNGDIILPFEYRKIGEYGENGLIAVEDINWKWGYADKKGNIVIPCQYHNAAVFSDGLAGVSLEKDVSFYINEQTEEVVPPFTAYKMGVFHNGIAPIEFDKKETSFINKKGEVVIPPIKGRCRYFTEGLFYIDGNDGGWLMNSQGKMITPKQGWVLRGIFSEGLMGYGTITEKKYGFINTNGEVAIPAQFDEVRNFSEGLAAVKLNNKWGFIDKEGNIIIPCQFDGVDSNRNFSEGLAAVCLNKKWGFINKLGKIVIPCIYDSAKEFCSGYTVVRNNNNQPALIDKQGNICLGFGRITAISGFSDGLCHVSTSDRTGYADIHGNSIMVPRVK